MGDKLIRLAVEGRTANFDWPLIQILAFLNLQVLEDSDNEKAHPKCSICCGRFKTEATVRVR